MARGASASEEEHIHMAFGALRAEVHPSSHALTTELDANARTDDHVLRHCSWKVLMFTDAD